MQRDRVLVTKPSLPKIDEERPRTKSEIERKRSFTVQEKANKKMDNSMQNNLARMRKTVLARKSREDILLEHLKFDAPKLQRTKKHRIKFFEKEVKRDSRNYTFTGYDNILEKMSNETKIQVNDEGIFILYHLANLILSTDYEKCYKLCKINFSFISNSHLFETNLLRLKGMALEQIYKKHTTDNRDDNLPDLGPI